MDDQPERTEEERRGQKRRSGEREEESRKETQRDETIEGYFRDKCQLYYYYLYFRSTTGKIKQVTSYTNPQLIGSSSSNRSNQSRLAYSSRCLIIYNIFP